MLLMTMKPSPIKMGGLKIALVNILWLPYRQLDFLTDFLLYIKS